MRSSTRCDRPHRAARDRGQAVVELALTMPLVCLLLLGVVQVGLVVRDHIVVVHLAREAARAAAVSATPNVAAARAIDGAPIDDVAVAVVTGTRDVRATVTAVTRTDVPLIGALLPDVGLRATAVMVLEPP
jgi:Flp pilus assembly protein TadG